MSGRALARPPDVRQSMGDFANPTGSPKAASDSKAMPYHENGLRWVEKQEARALREAMEEMEAREEAKVHANAQDEASQLVWQHMSGNAPRDSQAGRRDYREHLREGSHARSLSKAWGKQESSPEQTKKSRGRDTMDVQDTTTSTAPPKAAKRPNIPDFDGEVDETKPRVHIKWDSPEKKAYTNLAFHGSRIDKGRRRSSGAKKRHSSGGPFKNPDDQIYEDEKPFAPFDQANYPKDSRNNVPLAAHDAASATNTNSSGRHFLPSTRIPTMKSSNLHRSRTPEAPSYSQEHRPNEHGDVNEATAEKSHQLEIRSDEIRAATSKRLKDRSPKLPTPAFISGKPGQHIVSFDKGWKPKDQSDAGRGNPRQSSASYKRPAIPIVTTSAPVIPTISVTANTLTAVETSAGLITDLPLISVSEDQAPSDGSDKLQSNHVLANKPTPANRPLPHHSSTSPVRTSKTHWSPMLNRTTAQCAACALPIAGRIVSAASQRFHPGCFNCHHCQTALECVAFYPEPENKRFERLARIQSRIDGEEVPDEQPGETAEDDGDESLRFYCHLDFHEIFSPRCRNCKTPIESEVIVACGGTWHVGHFFCAECGDPFDPKTPFVEKDGYAWCVKCHAGRFSGKCKGCKKAVVEAGINALGAEWHESCFVCAVRLLRARPQDI